MINPNHTLIESRRTWPWLIVAAIVIAMVFGVAWLRFPLNIIYGCALQNLHFLAQPGVSDGWTMQRYTCPTAALEDVPPPQISVGIALALGTLLLMAAYGLGFWAIRRIPTTRFTTLLIWLIPFGFLLLLLPTFPITSVDLYDYAFRGRMAVHYQANNFISRPNQFTEDPLFWYTAWRRSVTAYGPVWEGLSWVTARIAGQAPGIETNPKAGLWPLLMGYKLLSVFGYLLVGGAIWGFIQYHAPRWKNASIYLWLWNPLVLWETAGAGHNDAWMALWMVLACWGFMWVQRRPDRYQSAIPALVSLTIGGLVKYSALLFGPTLLAAALRLLPNWRTRLRLVVVGGVVCLSIVTLAYAPFWAGIATLRNFTDRGELVYASWLAVVQGILAQSIGKGQSQIVANLIGLGLLLIGVIWSAWRGWKHPHDPIGNMLWLLLWFLFIANPWFQPWYLIWALALVALIPWRTQLITALSLLSCAALLTYPAGAFLHPHLPWPSDGAYWNLLLAVLLYPLPLLVLGWRRFTWRWSFPAHTSTVIE